MLFTKNINPDVDQFWKDLEDELGIPILCRVLGRVVQDYPLWGLFYTTSYAIYFQTFESENWLSSLFTGKKGRKRTENRRIEIPLSSLNKCEIVPKKKGLLGLFSPPALVDIAWTDDAKGEQQTLLVDMYENAKQFVETVSGEEGDQRFIQGR